MQDRVYANHVDFVVLDACCEISCDRCYDDGYGMLTHLDSLGMLDRRCLPDSP